MKLIELNTEQVPELLNVSIHCHCSLFFNTLENTFLLYFDVGGTTYKLLFIDYICLISFLNNFETSFVIHVKEFVNDYCSKFCIEVEFDTIDNENGVF